MPDRITPDSRPPISARIPIVAFRSWYDEALFGPGEPEPEAMAARDLDPRGAPSVRFVLLKGVSDRGFVFYTNSQSRKAGEIALTGWASMAFRWSAVSRQVRVSGSVGPLSPEESDEYFAARDRGSQLGAWASGQSEVLQSRAELEARLAEVTSRYEAGPVPRPPWWGGYLIDPYEIEFWQQGEFRLHDRFRYRRGRARRSWLLERLNP